MPQRFRARHEEIAEAVGVPRKTIDDWTEDFGESPADGLSPFPPDFDPPIYNVWKPRCISGHREHGGSAAAPIALQFSSSSSLHLFSCSSSSAISLFARLMVSCV
jgi:hypothetical protein